MKQFEIESHPDFDGHEVVRVEDSNRLKAIIAVHNTSLGPSAGGCRMYPYASEQDALTDVLRLSRAMTFKSALAGIPVGGGKSVIIGNPAKDKTTDLLHAMGEFVDSLDGRYIVAEDSGTSVQDLIVMGERTRHITGVKPEETYGGDPSPMTAYGVFVGIRQALAWKGRKEQGDEELANASVAIQGVGNVGGHLAEMLLKAGARVLVADVNPDNAERARSMGAEIIDPARIHAADVDVFSPCALGGAVNPGTVHEIRAGLVAGAANNQLASEEMGRLLKDRGIIFAPDFVLNAGGIVDVYYQQQDACDREKAVCHINRIGPLLKKILSEAEARDLPPNVVADEMAREVLQGAGRP